MISKLITYTTDIVKHYNNIVLIVAIQTQTTKLLCQPKPESCQISLKVRLKQTF